MSKPVAWSYSALDSFETCGWRHYLTRVSKQVADPPGEAAKWGLEAHKAFENHLKHRTPLPEALLPYAPLCRSLITAGGKLLVEHQIALTKDFRTTTWFGKDVWVRSVVDAGVDKGRKLVACDWKLGRRKVDSAQMRLFAANLFHSRPHVNEITTLFMWLPDKKADKEVFYRADLPELWKEFLPRVRRLEIAHEEQKWPKRPSGLCKKWCPVPPDQCEFRHG